MDTIQVKLLLHAEKVIQVKVCLVRVPNARTRSKESVYDFSHLGKKPNQPQIDSLAIFRQKYSPMRRAGLPRSIHCRGSYT